MNLLLRHEPWGLHREVLNALLGNDESNPAAAEWTPAVDIEEHADKYVLTADVPGVDPATIEITLEKGLLTLAGSRDKAVEQPGIESRRTERIAGRFLRRFTLPESVDAEGVKATGKQGVLQVVIPKREAAKARKITVNS